MSLSLEGRVTLEHSDVICRRFKTLVQHTCLKPTLITDFQSGICPPQSIKQQDWGDTQ